MYAWPGGRGQRCIHTVFYMRQRHLRQLRRDGMLGVRAGNKRRCTPRVPAMSLRTDKQRMLRQRIAQIQAEEKVAQQQLASYRAYQQRELEEVRPCVV